MGVAGDGNSKLESFDMSSMAKSRDRSAKNAWGKSTGYADELIERGMESQRAQQLENWKNQQEVLAAKKSQRFMTDEFDQGTDDSQWALGKLGADRNQVCSFSHQFILLLGWETCACVSCGSYYYVYLHISKDPLNLYSLLIRGACVCDPRTLTWMRHLAQSQQAISRVSSN